ncbi:MAG: rhomboid family intramembrane serine protease [bacterium]|nr:rhomboid family intramembrane serine protease [bacterium]
MRLIGKFQDENAARTFSDYLTQLEIDNQVALEPDGTGEVWVISEDDVKHAEQLLAKFRENPDDGEYKDAGKKAEKIRKKARKEEKKQAPVVDVRTKVFSRGGRAPRGTLTFFLVIVSVVVSVLSGLGENSEFLRKFLITEITAEGGYIYWHKGLREIMDGQIWRLVTPIFIHFGIMHLAFNMMWLYDLGNMLEDRKSSWFLGIFIAVVAIASNLAQYLVSSPNFGGMSGVVYGLLGYAWMKTKYDPNSRIYLHKTTVIMMIGWFFLCFTGLMGNIANGAHAAGLIIGVAWGYLTSPHFKKHFQ